VSQWIKRLVVMTALVACGGSNDVTVEPAETTIDSGAAVTSSLQPVSVSCRDATGAESDDQQGLTLSLEPNPVPPDSEATLTVTPGADFDDRMVGASLEWQCWDGTAWVPTHQLFRSPHFQGGAGALEVEPGGTTAAPAVGVPLPTSDTILIPDVPAGTYRIVDRALAPDGTDLLGSVRVEVQ
jgi:hypothetical protein